MCGAGLGGRVAVGELVEQLQESLALVLRLAADLEVSEMSGMEAASWVERFTRAESACAAGKARCARRVAETKHFEREGHKDAATWLAEKSGESRNAAEQTIRLGEGLAQLPDLGEAFGSGEVSERQASQIVRAAEADPESLQELLGVARHGSYGELRDRADQVVAAARSQEEDERRLARIRANRHLRSWKDVDGGLAGRFLLAPEDGAVVMGRLQQIANDVFDQARRAGERERQAAYLADALVILARGEEGGLRPSSASGAPGAPDAPSAPSAPEAPDAPGAPAPFRQDSDHGVTNPSGSEADRTGRPARPECRAPRPDYTVIMRVDLAALARGHLEGGEECSIDGSGPVPVSLVQRYLDEAHLRLVVTKGTDIASVFSFSRTIPAALRTALMVRDRTCVVPGCNRSYLLEIDHIKEFSKGGPTSLDNLCRLCREHHRLKTIGRYRIDGPPGCWRWVTVGPGP